MTIIRKIFALAISLILLLSIFTVSVSASQSTVYGIGFVKASTLRLREEPNTNSATLDTAPENDSVVVLSKCGNWYKVNYNLQEGYMHEDYLRVSGIENAELGYGRITGDSVNLRTGPSTSHSIAAVTVKNEKCYIITRAMSFMPNPGIDTEGWFAEEPGDEYRDCRDSCLGFGNPHINEKGFALIAKRVADNAVRVLREGKEPLLEREIVSKLVSENK
jgi:uncharacterized protein YraI